MFKKLLLVFSMLFLFLNLISITYKNNENILHNKQQNYNSLILQKNNDNNNKKYSYNSFFPLKIKKWGYYGRVLKYYYANQLKFDDPKEIEHLRVLIDIKGNESDNAKEFFIQNLISSIFNISIYGSTNDREFFAEAFLKWLQTPDKIKDKSWEITNYFFINLLPKIIKYSGPINTMNNNNLTVEKNIIAIIENDLKLKNKSFINISSTSNQLSTDLRFFSYQIKIIKKIKTQILLEFDVNNNIRFKWNDRILIYFSLSKWNQIIRAKANEETIKEFNHFINSNKYFKDFSDLDNQLQMHSKDNFGYSQIWFSNFYNDLDKTFKSYLNKKRFNNVDFEQWESKHLEQLKEVTLLIYNTLYYLLENDLWVKNIISAIFFAKHLKLEEQEKNVLGYTFSSINENTNLLEETYIVILTIYFLQKEYSSDYVRNWSSSPTKFATLVHEFGHALDNFGSKLLDIRQINFSSKTSYIYKYQGDFFAEKQPSYPINNKVILFIAVASSIIFIYSIKIIYDNWINKRKEE